MSNQQKQTNDSDGRLEYESPRVEEEIEFELEALGKCLLTAGPCSPVDPSRSV
jgi:hypothetical protein